MPYFAQMGYDVYAVSLRGHGNSPLPKHQTSLWSVRLADYVQDVKTVIDQKFPVKSFLIGHSLGGMVVQKYLEQEDPDHSLSGAVLLASVPGNGMSWTAAVLDPLRKHPWLLLKANLTGNLLGLVNTSDLAREYFFTPDTPQAFVEGWVPHLQKDSYLAFLDVLLWKPVQLDQVRNKKILVVGSDKDKFVTVDEFHATAKAYGGEEALIFEGMPHHLMVAPGWERVAEAIADWFERAYE